MLSAISVCLSNPDDFTPFYPYMEMLCREHEKDHGKMIFPLMTFNITGLELEKKYEVFFSLERLGNEKYTYESNEWKVLGVSKDSHEYKKLSTESQTGAKWMKEPLSFPEARITNKKTNNDKYTFYLTPLRKYVPVIHIRDVETSVEQRFAVEQAQFLPTTKNYNKELQDWKTRHNRFSTYRNGGTGNPTNKRKATGHSDKAPRTKRQPLQEQQDQPNNWNAVNFSGPQPSTSTLGSTNYNYNPMLNYAPAPGYNQFNPSNDYYNNFGYNPSAPINYHPGYYGHQHHHYNNNFNGHQYPSVPMTNYAPTFPDYSTPMTVYPTLTGSPDAFFPQGHNENSAQLPVAPFQFNGFY